MNYQLPDIKKASVATKKVFVTTDLDVPLSDRREIEDDTRLRAGLPTVEYLLGRRARIIVGGKLGRPGGKVDRDLSLEPVARWYTKQERCIRYHLRFKNTREKIGDLDGWELSDNFFVLENLRFYPGEEKNDLDFSKKLAGLADIYVNDAFALSHRNNASVVGIPNLLPHFAGLHLQEEVKNLSAVLDSPKRPLAVVIGGKKMETKLPLVKKMLEIADHVLVGGKLAQEIKEFLARNNGDIRNYRARLIIGDSNKELSDITAESIKEFMRVIHQAEMVVWNGSMGIIDKKSGVKSQESKVMEDTEKGTRELAHAIVESKAYKVVGGGDTVEYLQRIGLVSKFDFVSTGGGAMLAFLSGEKLPGLEALLDK